MLYGLWLLYCLPISPKLLQKAGEKHKLIIYVKITHKQEHVKCQANRKCWLLLLILKKGDVVVCETGDVIPSDGEVIEGIASVDESAITGESAPVIRESGGDRWQLQEVQKLSATGF